MTDTSVIKLPSLTAEGEVLIEAAAAMQFNDIARKYGAKLIPVSTSTLTPKSRPDTRYKMKSLSDVLQSEPINWRVKGVVPERGIAAIYGPSGSGKSFLVVNMAIAIANGAEWFGYRVESCPVTYVCLGGEAGLSVRLTAYRTKGGTPKGIKFIDQSVNPLDTKELRDLATAIKVDQMGEGIVIIDTLNRAVPEMDENSLVDIGHAINACKLIQQGVGGLVYWCTTQARMQKGACGAIQARSLRWMRPLKLSDQVTTESGRWRRPRTTQTAKATRSCSKW